MKNVKFLSTATITLGLLTGSAASQAEDIFPNRFTANTKAVAEEVNQNFDALQSVILSNQSALNGKVNKTDSDARFQQIEDDLAAKAELTELQDVQTQLDQKLGMVASLGYQKTPTVRGVTISNVTINGGSIVSPVAPGSDIEVEMDYHIVDTGCPGCIDQIQIGFSQEAPKGCVYNGIPGTAGASGSGKITLTAPAEPGIYYIGVDRSQAYSCPTGWWNNAPSAFNRYIAVIAVQ